MHSALDFNTPSPAAAPKAPMAPPGDGASRPSSSLTLRGAHSSMQVRLCPAGGYAPAVDTAGNTQQPIILSTGPNARQLMDIGH